MKDNEPKVVMVVGSGAREHTICAKFASEGCKVICAPGSEGMRKVAEVFPETKATDIQCLVKLAKDNSVGLTIVGPDAPVVAGIGDAFRAAGLWIICPSRSAARLEGSKVWAKMFMTRHNIPTAPYQIASDSVDAYRKLVRSPFPLVVKADGLAQGKGVFVCQNIKEAGLAIRTIMIERRFGSAGDAVVIENCLVGQERSYTVLADGTNILKFVTAMDHKPIFDGNRGPNTGGMGCISADALLTAEMKDRIMAEIVEPTIRGMRQEGRPYSGVLYFGLMITADGPKVLEYNARLGDPETEVILRRLESSFLDLLVATDNHTLDQVEPVWNDKAAVCLVVASRGYPGDYEVGKVITGLTAAKSYPGVELYHAGTRFNAANGEWETAGGRVVVISVLADTVALAGQTARAAARCIEFDGIHGHFRTDIG